MSAVKSEVEAARGGPREGSPRQSDVRNYGDIYESAADFTDYADGMPYPRSP